MKNKRLSDQVLILNSIEIVREELLELGNPPDPRKMSDILERLTNLYSCLDCKRLADIIKQQDERSDYAGT